MMLVVLVITLVLQIGSISVEGVSERDLRRALLQDYDPHSRPVKDITTPVNVSIQMALSAIVNLDEKKQILTTIVDLEEYWVDEYLRWNATEFGGVRSLVIPRSHIWTPDTVVTNTLGDTEHTIDLYRGQTFTASHSGRVYGQTRMYLKSTCFLDMSRFPFDKQTCNFDYATWAYPNDQVNVTVASHPMRLALWESHEVSEIWRVTGLRGVDAPIMQDGGQFGGANFFVDLERKPLFYILNLLIPCILLAVLSTLSFLLPPEGGERVSLGVTTFLAFTVFGLVLADKVPETSDSVPGISRFLIGAMTFNVFNVAWAIIIINVARVTSAAWRPPRTLTRVLRVISCSDASANHKPEPQIENPGYPELRGKGAEWVESQARKGFAEEWKAVVRGLDRIFFVGSSVFIAVELLVIL